MVAQAMTAPPLTVCVVCEDRPVDLAPLVAGLTNQNQGRGSFELVVVSAARVDLPSHELTVRVVDAAPGLSYGALHNLAWRSAASDKIAFLAPDLVPAPNWVAGMTSGLARGRRIVTGGWLPAAEAVRAGAPVRSSLWWSPRTLPVVTAQQLGCLRQDLEIIDGFDETEADPFVCDTLLAVRLSDAGADLYWARHAVAYHDVVETVPAHYTDSVRRMSKVLADHPRARARLLQGGILWHRRQTELLALILGLVLAPRDRRALLLVVPWVHERTFLTPLVGGARRKWAVLPGVLVRDLEEAWLTTSERLRPRRQR
jgi:hypothetical protein